MSTNIKKTALVTAGALAAGVVAAGTTLNASPDFDLRTIYKVTSVDRAVESISGYAQVKVDSVNYRAASRVPDMEMLSFEASPEVAQSLESGSCYKEQASGFFKFNKFAVQDGLVTEKMEQITCFGEFSADEPNPS